MDENDDAVGRWLDFEASEERADALEGDLAAEWRRTVGEATMEVRAALGNTRRLLPDYYARMLSQRAGADPAACGSVYPGARSADVAAMLESAEWEPHAHPSVMDGCVAFRASLPGRMGIVPTTDLPADARVALADPKGTGFVDATTDAVPHGAAVDFTVAIIGEEAGERVLFTFHPGDPVPPSRVPARGMAGRVVDPDTALAMGLTFAKVVRGELRGGK